jgi:hypothetical protein
MNLVAGKQQSARVFARRKKHPMLRGVRRSIGYTVLRGMNVQASTQFARNSFLSRTIDNFLDRKFRSLRPLLVQKCCRNKDFRR